MGSTWELIDGQIENPDQYHLNSIITANNGFIYIVGENGIGFTSNGLDELRPPCIKVLSPQLTT
jgi:hypothetical protein